MSTDDTAARAAALKGSVDLRLHDWPIFEADYQRRAYIHAARLYEWEFSWMAFFDTDEFLVLEEGKDLSDLLFSQFGSAGIAVPWAMYGSSGHRNRPNGLVIDNYIYRSNNDFPPNRHVKTIARPERIIDFGHVHMPTIDGRYTDLMGREISFSAPGIMNSRPDYRGGKLHHYFTRSWEDWLIKIQRGYNDTVRPVDEFYSYDLNNVFDDSARRLLSRVAFYLSAHKL
jgi:hypothetical protein